MAAYDAATSSLLQSDIKAPSAGVDVMPPQTEPSVESVSSFSSSFATRQASTMGTMVMTAQIADCCDDEYCEQ